MVPKQSVCFLRTQLFPGVFTPPPTGSYFLPMIGVYVMWACDVIGKPSQRSRVVVAPESFQCRSKVVVVGTNL